MLDTQEAIDHQAEVSRMLSERLTDEDEEDILRELEELRAESVRRLLTLLRRSFLLQTSTVLSMHPPLLDLISSHLI